MDRVAGVTLRNLEFDVGGLPTSDRSASDFPGGAFGHTCEIEKYRKRKIKKKNSGDNEKCIGIEFSVFPLLRFFFFLLPLRFLGRIFGHQRAQRQEFAEAQQDVAGEDVLFTLGCRDHARASGDAQDQNFVVVTQAAGRDGGPGQRGVGGDREFRHAVAGLDGHTLPDIHIGERDLFLDVVHHGPGDVDARCPLDAFEPGRGVDFHHLRAILALEHIHTSNTQAHDLGGFHRGLLILIVELHRLGGAAAVDIRAELGARGFTPHGPDNLAAHHKCADVFALALSHKLLQQHVLPGGLERLNNRLGDVNAVGKDDADTLRTLDEFDDHRHAAERFDRGQHIFLATDKSRGGDADVVPTEDLHRPQFVAADADRRRGVQTEHAHLLKLPNDRCAEVGDARPDAGDDRVGFAEVFAVVGQVGRTGFDIHREPQGVADPQREPACLGRLFESADGVAVGVTREDNDFHGVLSGWGWG